MKRVMLSSIGAALVASTVAFAPAGGWAVVTVSKIPDAWIAGKPLQLTWQVRQHGRTMLDDLKPGLEARSGRRRIRGMTWAFDEDGQKGYRGRITLPSTGEWRVTIESGFGSSRAELIPFGVVDSVTSVRGTVESHLEQMGVAPLHEVERGRRMFASLGCVTCHVNRAVGIEGQANSVGPDLTDRTFEPGYLARFLANPSIKPPSSLGGMPNLALREKDILPLIAFINRERRLTSR